METLASRLRCPIKGKWAASIDLKDAYLQVPVSPGSQNWLLFQVQGQDYEWSALRAVDGSAGFYPRGAFSRSIPETQRSECVYLPGRLADLQPVPGRVEQACTTRCSGSHEVGFYGQ